MTQNSVINFKVFLRDGSNTDTRRFTVDAPVVTNFMFLNEKLRSIFPALKEAHYKITWKDSDGDEITIDSDEDLITALTEMTGAPIKMLYITILGKNDDYQDTPVTLEADINIEPGTVLCDVCENRIDGFRYKCIQCPDYDLCRDCEHKGHHSEHMMVRMVISDAFPRFTRRFVHDISRCMKKNIRAARKDAHKFSKHCQRASSENPFCATGKKFHCKAGEFTENKKDIPPNEQPSGSCGQNKSNDNEGFCPFSSGNAVNVEDFQALGALARQHLDPILNMLTPPAQSQNGAEPPLLLNVIQNAVDGFFGRFAPQTSTEQQKKPEENSGPNQTESKPAGNETPKQNNQNKTPTGQENSASAPMDLDNNNPPMAPQPTLGSTMTSTPATTNQQTPSFAPNPHQEKPAEPGWAFVAQNTRNGPNSSAENNTVQPVAPTIIYHSNPVIAEGLTRLHEMGFSNESGLLTQLLEHHNGDVNEVVKALVDLRI